MRKLFLKIIILSLLSGLAAVTEAQNVTITGRVNKPNALVRLFVYEDLLNWEGNEADRITADAKGNFILETTVDNTIPAKIFVDLESVDMYITPNSTFDVDIIIPEQDEAVSYFDKKLPTLRIRRAGDHGVFRQMTFSEDIINDFLLNHFTQLYRQRQYRYLDTINAAISRKMPDIKSDYVKDYNRYKIASIQMAIDADGGKKVISKCFDGKPVLYTQPAYIDLFKELFANYFERSANDISEISDAFHTSPQAFKVCLLKDPFLARNPRLAELITIYNLEKVYNADSRNEKPAMAHLETLQKSTKYREHKEIAANTIARLKRFANGAPATDFELKDSQGKTTKLSDYGKDLVLLQFVDDYSAVNNQQFKVLKELHQQWQDSVQILTISTKDKMRFYQSQFEKEKYGWPLLSLGNSIMILESYDVRTFPEYVLIKPGTKIGIAPAPEPGENLEKYVRSLYRK